MTKLRLKHGLCVTGNVHPIYITWQAMIMRCCNPKHPKYKDYGGRGISVCDKWKNSVESFVLDMGPRPKGFLIERVDNNGNYEPNNCKWATRKSQQRNRRSNRLITLSGHTKTLAEWGEDKGVDPALISHRLRRGWSDSDAVNLPIDTRYAHFGKKNKQQTTTK